MIEQTLSTESWEFTALILVIGVLGCLTLGTIICRAIKFLLSVGADIHDQYLDCKELKLEITQLKENNRALEYNRGVLASKLNDSRDLYAGLKKSYEHIRQAHSDLQVELLNSKTEVKNHENTNY